MGERTHIMTSIAPAAFALLDAIRFSMVTAGAGRSGDNLG